MPASPAATVAFVYVGNAESQDITVLGLAADGSLRAIATVDLLRRPVPGLSLPLAVSPDRQFLFAAIRAAPYEVATYRIESESGRLAYVDSGPLAASIAYIATDRAGRFLLGASYDASLVTVSAIGAEGVVGDTVQTRRTAPHAHCVLAAPSNEFVLHTSLGGDVIYQDRFDPRTGTLTPNEPPTASVKQGAGPRHFVFSPAGDVVYLLNELDGTIYVFPFDASTGTLGSPTQIASALPDGFEGKPWAADIHVTSDGRFLYASERTSSTLAAFRVDGERGTLTRIGTYPTAKQPRAFAIDPSGRTLLAVGQLSTAMTSYAIDPRSGQLTQLAETPVGKNPNWVEIVPAARPSSP